MRWVVRSVETGDDAVSRSADLIEICRPEGLGEIADLGLSLPEAKLLLTSVQRAVAAINMGGFVRIAVPAAGDAT